MPWLRSTPVRVCVALLLYVIFWRLFLYRPAPRPKPLGPVVVAPQRDPAADAAERARFLEKIDDKNDKATELAIQRIERIDRIHDRIERRWAERRQYDEVQNVQWLRVQLFEIETRELEWQPLSLADRIYPLSMLSDIRSMAAAVPKNDAADFDSFNRLYAQEREQAMIRIIK